MHVATLHTQFATAVVGYGLMMSSALFVWKLMYVLGGSALPLVVVLSGSMEPGLYRGDLILLDGPSASDPLKIGDTVVYNANNLDGVPVVHRILTLHERYILPPPTGPPRRSKGKGGHFLLVTKGDNNPMSDAPLATGGQGLFRGDSPFLDSRDVVGRARGVVPIFGIFTVYLNEIPYMKMSLIIGLLIAAILQQKGRD